MSLNKSCPSPLLFLKLSLLCCLRWLVEVVTADVPATGAPVVIITHCRPIT
jgi:hypothetical protein